MSRRALRKISPALEVARYLRPLAELPQPLSGEALFGRAAPWEVEVGSGKGLFLSAAAAAHPERNYLGVEVARKYAEHAAARLAKAGCRNALMIHGDALRLFHEWLPDASLAAVHVYFPDPWWKKRHQKRRVMQPPLIHDIERTLQPGGVLHFWTDVEEYFRNTLELLAAESRLTGPIEVAPHDPQHDLDYRTHFERRMRLNDLPVYRSEFVKKSTEVTSPTADG